MSGKKIIQARNALILFLKSLPEKSKFNIISFGSDFSAMFPSSMPYDDETLQKAIS
jgi:hypothetical protein